MICGNQVLVTLIVYVILSKILYAVAESQLNDMKEVMVVMISFDIVYASLFLLIMQMFGGIC